MIHELKISWKYFDDVAICDKNFEIRKDDRDYKVGDIILLQECSKEDGLWTGRMVRRKIKYILRDVPDYGLKKGFIIIGF